MAKRALCVGCNYPRNGISLSGAVNDAFLVADCLNKDYGFEPEDIRVLHDMYPGQARSSQHLVDLRHRPTRVNILRDLRDLVRGAQPGDVLFFSFSGFGVQVDDLTAPQNEGFDDAILPTDFAEGGVSTCSVICTSDIHDILMGVPKGCTVTVLMDSDHSTSVIDVSGTLEGKLVNGLKLKGFCGAGNHTTKMQLSPHQQEVWQDEKARKVKAMPRFQPLVEVENPHQGQLPTRPAMSRSTPLAFCFSASSHGQTAVELEVQGALDGSEAPRRHGALSWSFARAAGRLGPAASYAELAEAIRKQMQLIRQKDCPSMDQDVLLTFSTPLSNPATMTVLRPIETPNPGGRCTSISGGDLQRKPGLVPQVVPPPPPGLISRLGESRSPEERGSLALAGLGLLRAALEPPAAPAPPAAPGGEAEVPADITTGAFLTCESDMELVRAAMAPRTGSSCSKLHSVKTRTASPSSTCSTCDAASLLSSGSEDEASLVHLQACWGLGLRSLFRRALPGRRSG